MADQKTEPVKYWKIQADGLDSIGMFHQAGTPGMSLQAQEFKVWDDQGKPLPLPVGVQPSFTDVQLSRGVDSDATLYKWISKVAQQGATPETVKDVTLIALDADNNPVHTYVLKQAFPVSYGAGGMNAAGTDVLTEQLTLKYTDFTMDGAGGLTGDVG
jgi:phage tail-like protein